MVHILTAVERLLRFPRVIYNLRYNFRSSGTILFSGALFMSPFFAYVYAISLQLLDINLTWKLSSTHNLLFFPFCLNELSANEKSS